MTVASATSKSGPYNGNGVQTVFAYGFKVFADTELEVIRAAASGAETTLTLGTDYTVSGVGLDVGGNVTLTAAPASGETLVILRSMPFTQQTDLRNQGGFYPEVHERVFDRIVMQVQQLKEAVERAVKVTASSGADPDALIASVESSEANAAASASSASSSASTATAAASTATAAAANLPNAATAGASKFVRSNAGGTGWDYRTAAQVLSDIGAAAAATAAALNASQTWTAGQTPYTAALSDAATVNWNANNAQVATVTCTAGRTFAAPTNLVASRFYGLAITNSGGAHAHAFNAAFIFNSDLGTPGSFPSGARLFLTFQSDGTSLREWGRSVVAS
ncbi:MAG: Pelagibacter phage [Pseudomonadota bacterium]